MSTSKSKKDPREALLDGFIELIGTIGAHQVTLQKAAKKAKVPFSTAHYYYGGDWNKIFEDAVTKVITTSHSYVANYLQEHSTATSNPVELYVDATFQWILSHKSHVQLWLFNYYFTSIFAKSVSRQAEYIEIARQRVLNLLFEAKGRGFYKKLAVTQEAANATHGLIFAYAIMAVIQNSDPKRVKQINEETKELIAQNLLK